MLADTGCRISELIQLQWKDIDFDNLLITVNGKGDKQRVIPFSFELRKFLYRLRQNAPKMGENECPLVFPTRTFNMQRRANVLRDVEQLCAELKINTPPRTLHAFRHSFAINYLRKGGSVFHLQKSLGHSDLGMTRRYANLLTDDLQAVHPKVSLLSR